MFFVGFKSKKRLFEDFDQIETEGGDLILVPLNESHSLPQNMPAAIEEIVDSEIYATGNQCDGNVTETINLSDNQLFSEANDVLGEIDLSDHQFSSEVHPVFEDINLSDHHLRTQADTEFQEIVSPSDNNRTKKKRTRTSTPSDENPSKKRKVNPTKWKAAEAKKAHNLGVAHTSLRGKEVGAKEMKNGCSDSCKRKCHFKISEERRRALFQKYWAIGDKALQWYFLAKLVHPRPIKRRKVEVIEDEDPYRKNTFEYTLPDFDSALPKPIVVCKQMFLATFSISATVVRNALTKNSPDKRGKHTQNRKRMSTVLIYEVKSHIKSFPIVPSHYCRADSSRKYLDEHLSVSQMFRLYIGSRNINDKDTASVRQYRDIFNSCFNLSFFKPKKDQCAVCCEWDGLNPDEKNLKPDLKKKYEEHMKNKEHVRELKKNDKEASRVDEGKKTRVLTVDLQKVLYSPTSDVGEFFYKSKLSCYNYTVYDCTKREGHLYVWDQTIGRRGSDETSSFMLDYIEIVVEDGVVVIIVYSDACGGQNRSQYYLTMYYMAAMKYGITIVHRYLEKGHTQMECDSVHARIEKKGKKKVVMVPSEWYGIMKTAKVKKPAYKVNEKKNNEIFTFRGLAETYFQWSKVPLSKVREIKISGENPGIVKFRVSWEEEERTANILITRVGRPINWKAYQPKLAYSARIPLPDKLKQHLKWFLQKGHIPEKYAPYYNNLFAIEHREDGSINLDVEVPPETSPDLDDDEPEEIVPVEGGDLNNNQDYFPDLDEADPYLVDDPEPGNVHSISDNDSDSCDDS